MLLAGGELGETLPHPKQDKLGGWRNTTLQHVGDPQQLDVDMN